MDMTDVFRQFGTEDEDLKVIQMLGLRLFNALATSVKLALSGYFQNSALIMRDILETVFLLSLFNTDRRAITRWRFADKKARFKEFRPLKVREALDNRDGFTSQKRAEMYELFSELAGHPSMKSAHMLRPKGMDARNGPFMDRTALEAVLSELGRLAVQAGEGIGAFLPSDWPPGASVHAAFTTLKVEWIGQFYGKHAAAAGSGPRASQS
jgi:hypothetical protein